MKYLMHVTVDEHEWPVPQLEWKLQIPKKRNIE